MQLDVVTPTQVPPLQLKEVAAGEQLARRVELCPGKTVAGLAVRVQTGGALETPVPVTLTLCGLPPALVVTVIEPTLAPIATGLKVTLKVQELPGARLAGQLLTTLKTGKVGAMLVMVRLITSVLFRVTVFAALALPTF